MSVVSTCLGFPRIGPARELKKSLESYWSKKSPRDALLSTARELREKRWSAMRDHGIDWIPSNEFSLYDQVLDMAVTLGAVPERYRAIDDPLDRYFAMARGLQDAPAGVDVPALEMTKWFDTNYHYIVPEIELGRPFALDLTKILAEVREARALGIEIRPVVLGPLSFLLLSKLGPGAPANGSTLDALPALVPVYAELLGNLAREGVEWIQLDEPSLVLDLDDRAREAYARVLPELARLRERPKLFLATYFEGLGDNLSLATSSGADALHVDLVRAPEQLDDVLPALHDGTLLSLGVVDGRNVWITDLDQAHALVRRAVRALGQRRVAVAPSCSLLHVPVTLSGEKELDPELTSYLAFAVEKLEEVRAIARAAGVDSVEDPAFERARSAIAARRRSVRTRKVLVRSRVAAITESMFRRSAPFSERAGVQRARFGLPLFPTTTIGSFPQTTDVRGARAARRAGKISEAEYEAFLREETRRCVTMQDSIGLDVLVHGEFERNDMVEYFGERLDGFAFTANGWVQSYGSRCVKPPLLYGDVARQHSMTVNWSRYAQSLTSKPMKGMLTGPVTILQWSFVRDDQPRSESCFQLALALRDEVQDLEAAGIGMIQVDEPALREGLPLRRAKREAYLAFAVDGFRLATSGVRDDTQIHTHMCYSEFGEILPAIARMDADVISIETSRSKMDLLADFRHFAYPNDVGPGVYDIHSPRVPSVWEMLDLITRAQAVLPAERLWINPDCGLKTRGWPEVEAALRAMVEAARLARSAISKR